MANYATLKTAIQNVIRTNGANEITGQILQNALIAMVDSLGHDYQFVGVATPFVNPGTPDQKVAYLAATPGTYTYFGNLVLYAGEVAILLYNGSWTKQTTLVGTNAQVLKVVGKGTSGTAAGITAAGQCYYNTSSQFFNICTKYDGNNSTYMQVNPPAGVIYIYGGQLCSFNGSDFVPYTSGGGASITTDITNFASGYYNINALKGNVMSPSATVKCQLVQVYKGDMFEVACAGGDSSSRAWALMDTAGVIYERNRSYAPTKFVGIIRADKDGWLAVNNLPSAWGGADGGYIHKFVSVFTSIGTEIASLKELALAARVGFLPFDNTLTLNDTDTLALMAIKQDIPSNTFPKTRGFLFYKSTAGGYQLHFGSKLDNAQSIAASLAAMGSLANYSYAIAPGTGKIICFPRTPGNIRIIFEGSVITVAPPLPDEAGGVTAFGPQGAVFFTSGGSERCLIGTQVADNEGWYHLIRGSAPYNSDVNWEEVTPGEETEDTPFRLVQRDPWTGAIYAAVGNLWYVTTDGGDNWTELARASTIGWESGAMNTNCFIFTEDYIYWATAGDLHTLNRASRSGSVMDTSSRDVIAILPYGQGTDSMCYIDNPRGLFLYGSLLTGQNAGVIKCLFWSIPEKKLYNVADLQLSTGASGGHKGCSAFLNYATGQELRPAAGFAGQTTCDLKIAGATSGVKTIYYEI